LSLVKPTWLGRLRHMSPKTLGSSFAMSPCHIIDISWSTKLHLAESLVFALGLISIHFRVSFSPIFLRYSHASYLSILMSFFMHFDNNLPLFYIIYHLSSVSFDKSTSMLSPNINATSASKKKMICHHI